MQFLLHKNDLGSFQELAHVDDVMFGQLSLLKVNPHCVRGGHYHKRKFEWFACIHGKCCMEIVDIRDGSKRTLVFDESHIEFMKILPYESHTVANTRDNVCELLVIVSEPYNPDDPDTIKVLEDGIPLYIKHGLREEYDPTLVGVHWLEKKK